MLPDGHNIDADGIAARDVLARDFILPATVVLALLLLLRRARRRRR